MPDLIAVIGKDRFKRKAPLLRLTAERIRQRHHRPCGIEQKDKHILRLPGCRRKLTYRRLPALALNEGLFRLQNEQRRPTLAIFRATGMAEADIRRLTHYEYRTVALQAIVYVVFAMAVLLSLLAV